SSACRPRSAGPLPVLAQHPEFARLDKFEARGGGRHPRYPTMETRPTLGVDVCKAFLDTCLLSPDGSREDRRFENDPGGIAALLREKTRLGNRLRAPGSLPALAARQIEARLRTLGEETEEIERERRRLVREDEGLARDARSLGGLKGVGEAIALLVLSLAGS